MAGKAVFRMPMKGLRVLVALVCGAFAGISFFAFSLNFGNGGVSFVTGAVLVAAGLAALFLERVCEIDGARQSLYSAWFFMNFQVGPGTEVFLDGADSVRLALVEMQLYPDFYPDRRRIIKATKAFPVWVMRGEKALGYVIGWKQPEDPASGRGDWDRCTFNSAWFPEYARYVAATCAKALELPLVDQMNKKTVPPAEIPAEWLDKNKVRHHLKWGLE
ncbi:MAG: hypothetical protein V1673_05355 [Candidatus Omnitrophota bacterium]